MELLGIRSHPALADIPARDLEIAMRVAARAAPDLEANKSADSVILRGPGRILNRLRYDCPFPPSIVAVPHANDARGLDFAPINEMLAPRTAAAVMMEAVLPGASICVHEARSAISRWLRENGHADASRDLLGHGERKCRVVWSAYGDRIRVFGRAGGADRLMDCVPLLRKAFHAAYPGSRVSLDEGVCGYRLCFGASRAIVRNLLLPMSRLSCRDDHARLASYLRFLLRAEAARLGLPKPDLSGLRVVCVEHASPGLLRNGSGFRMMRHRLHAVIEAPIEIIGRWNIGRGSSKGYGFVTRLR